MRFVNDLFFFSLQIVRKTSSHVTINSTYDLMNEQMYANNARSICVDSGGTLAEILASTMQKDFIEYSVLRHISSGLLKQ